MKNNEITTIQVLKRPKMSREQFEKFLISKGFTSQVGGSYRSPCSHHVVGLVDLQKSLNGLAEFWHKQDTESIYQEIMNS